MSKGYKIAGKSGTTFVYFWHTRVSIIVNFRISSWTKHTIIHIFGYLFVGLIAELCKSSVSQLTISTTRSNSRRTRHECAARDVDGGSVVVLDAAGSEGTRTTDEHGDVGARAKWESRRWDDCVGVCSVRDVGNLWDRKDDGDDAWNGGGGDNDDDVRARV